MTAQKPKIVERRITSGNIWTILVALAGFAGTTGYNHYVPSDAANRAAKVSEDAAAKASEAAAKAAVVENTVATHTAELQMMEASVDQLRLDVAVLKSQGESAKAATQSNSDKLDRLLQLTYRLQGSSGNTGK